MTVRDVATRAELQSAWAASVGGDTIRCAAGVTFASDANQPLIAFEFKATGTSYITITTDGVIPTELSTSWPGSFTASDRSYYRMTAAAAANMPKWVSTGNQPVIVFDNEAHHIKFIGIEFHDDGTENNPALIGNGDTGPSDPTIIYPHHITFDQCFIHPFGEDGTFDRWAIDAHQPGEAGMIFNSTEVTITNTAIQGWAGLNLDNGSKLNASPILAIVFDNCLVEDCLLEGAGPLFFGGGGPDDPDHVATGTGWTYTSATLSNTTDLDVGDLFRVYSSGLANNHLQPIYNDPADQFDNPSGYVPRAGGYANGQILTVNHGTGAITFTHLTGGIVYNAFSLFTYAPTAGAFQLRFMGSNSGSIPFNFTKAQLRTALEACTTLEPEDFAIRTATDDGYPFAPNVIVLGINDGGIPSGQWQDPADVNPFTIVNNTLSGGNDPAFIGEAHTESYHLVQNSADGTVVDVPLNGAAVAWEGFQAHDTLIQRCLIMHPLDTDPAGGWPSSVVGIKGFVETKGLLNSKFNACIFNGEPTGFVLTVRSQGGATPWAAITGLEITNCLWATNNNCFPMQLQDGAYQTVASSDILIRNNLCLGPAGSSAHAWVQTQYGDDIRITHNTTFVSGYLFLGFGNPSAPTNFVLKDNIVRPGRNATVPCTDFPGPCWEVSDSGNNLFINDLSLDATAAQDFFNAFPGGWEVTDIADVEFIAPTVNHTITNSNYRLSPSSPYAAGNAREASDGTDVGVDFDELISELNFDPFSEQDTTPTVALSGKIALKGKVMLK